MRLFIERKFNMEKKQNIILEDYKESLDVLRINSKGLLLNNNLNIKTIENKFIL